MGQELIVWGNPNLDQATAEEWAATRNARWTRVGENAGWTEPEACPWLGDGRCDEPEFCEEDFSDCEPPPDD